MVHLYMDYYSAIKKNAIKPFASFLYSYETIFKSVLNQAILSLC